MENTTMAEKEQLEIVEEEIREAKRKTGNEDFEIEITDEPEEKKKLPQNRSQKKKTILNMARRFRKESKN